ncbi:DUF2294 domain-containing protein [Bacillus alkalicellulosilyticus]|uniref:DUF2294 domain-containing protein n=1 Tax=Alkalihalobacterium alkalicellulosilyticum TaxID=1912214 RepID=UPI001482E0E9|nr:DUF2294 domain-containing protein [Bacillus alkalicellulosilyticus]
MDRQKKGTLEAEISKALTQWEKEYLGRGSVQVKTDILRNMVIVSLKGILTPAEQALTRTTTGMLSIKKTRSDLIETGSDHLKDIIATLTGVRPICFHTDISTRSGERIIIFMLDTNLENQLEV